MRHVKVQKGLVHGIIQCAECGWSCTNYLTVQRKAAFHVRSTGHRVTGELGYAVTYEERAVRLPGR